MISQHQITQGYACKKRMNYLSTEVGGTPERALQQIYGQQVKMLANLVLSNPNKAKLLNKRFGKASAIQFEPSFTTQTVTSGKLDVLLSYPNGEIDLCIVTAKSSPDALSVENEVATQLHLAFEHIPALSRVFVLYVNPKYKNKVSDVSVHQVGFLKCKDVTRSKFRLLRDWQKRLAVLNRAPATACTIGKHCKEPFECEFLPRCEAECNTLYPIHTLPWYQSGKTSVKDIRALSLESVKGALQKMVVEAAHTGQPVIRDGAATILSKLVYPVHFLDFETVALPIPIWEGVTPYTPVPFQWSCHTLAENKQVDHHGFLATSHHDPRLAFIKSLISTVKGNGNIVVYNKGFEIRILRLLMDWYPRYRDELQNMIDRIVDLLPIVRKHYYHPLQRGSWSIKSVLPCLCPHLSYEQLDAVKNGNDAQLAFIQLLENNLTEAQKREIQTNLIDYCKLDTLAMLEIMFALIALSR